MSTAAHVAASVLDRAADEDDAIDEARAATDEIAADLAVDLQDAASDDGVSAEQADAFADHYVERVRLAAIEAARSVLPGVVRRAHGGISAAEGRKLERVSRAQIDAHRTSRRAASAAGERKSEPPR